MAIATANGTKPNQGEINQVLKMLRRLLPNKIVRAIDIILHPCCDITITDVQVSCSAAVSGNYDLTITLSKPISLNGSGYLQLIVGDVFARVNGSAITIFTEGSVITLENVSISPELSGDHLVTIQFILPTGEFNASQIPTYSPAVYIPASTAGGLGEVTFPAC